MTTQNNITATIINELLEESKNSTINFTTCEISPSGENLIFLACTIKSYPSDNQVQLFDLGIGYASIKKQPYSEARKLIEKAFIDDLNTEQSPSTILGNKRRKLVPCNEMPELKESLCK